MRKKFIEEVNVERFTPTADTGLSTEQVESRYGLGLTNKVTEKYSKSYIRIFVENVCTIFNLLGLVVFIALLSVGAELFDFVFVLVYIANLSIGIIQEIRAKKCSEKLSLIARKEIKAIRNGEEVSLPVDKIVLDDVIVLGIGNQIPADSIVLSGNLEVNESLLTGESDPVKKKAGDTLLAGSFVVSGSCIARADKVGKNNYAEQLSAKAKKYRKPRSELMNSLKFFIRAIAFVIIPIGVAYIIKSVLIVKVDVAESIRRTSTVIIGMIPSGMFLLTSLALAVGIIKLARHKTLVQDLYSLEMLARVDTICFDKTGTLTDGNMSVVKVIPIGKVDMDINAVISSVVGALKDENQTAMALRKYFGEEVFYTAEKTMPFNSARKMSAVTFENQGTFAIGASEFVLSKDACNSIKSTVQEQSAQGLRVLVLAHTEKAIIEDKAPDNFSPIALILIADNIREEAVSTVKWFKDNDVTVKVISGDNPVTVSEVSKRVGIVNAEKFISLDGLSDEQVAAAANEYTVFGRVSPEQKSIIVKALKEAGHTTAMTGDGVNDIIALKEADCAITVASGSEAARNVSHLVLMDNNFNSMPKVVHEGRRVINNVQGSTSLYLMKTLFTMLLSFFILWIPSMETYPFTLKQMNLLEFFVIGAASFFLSLQPNNSRVKGRFIKNVLLKTVPCALLMVINVAVIGLISLFDTSSSTETYTTMAVLSLTLAGVVNIFMICRPFNTYRTVLFTSIAIIIAVMVAIVVFNGLLFLGLNKLSLAGTGYRHILIVLGLMVLDFPISIFLNYLSSIIKFKKKPV